MGQRQLQIHITNDPMYMENGYTVYLREGGPCWIIDPGLPPQAERVIEHVRARSLKPEAIVLTHAHGDHIAGVTDVYHELGPLPLYLAEPEWYMLTDPQANLSAYFGHHLVIDVAQPQDLAPGSKMTLDGTEWLVLDVSGHSPGGRALYCAELGEVFVGDAVMAGGVGRTDFPTSSGNLLMRNIRENLMSLPDETRVHSGHGPDTTIGTERTTNPYILHGLDDV